MPKQYDKLSNFIQTIMEDVTRESQETIAKSDAEYQNRISEASDRCLADSYSFIKERISTIQMQAGQAISKKVLDNNRQIFQTRQEMKREILQLLHQKLEEYTTSDSYRKSLGTLTKTLYDSLKSQHITVFLRSQDMPLAPDIAALQPGYITVVPSDTITVGGVVGIAENNKRRIDASFDAMLRDIDEQFFVFCPLSQAEDEL